MAISSWLGSQRQKDQAPGDFDEIKNKDVNAFGPVKTVSFLWGQRSSVPFISSDRLFRLSGTVSFGSKDFLV